MTNTGIQLYPYGVATDSDIVEKRLGRWRFPNQHFRMESGYLVSCIEKDLEQFAKKGNTYIIYDEKEGYQNWIDWVKNIE